MEPVWEAIENVWEAILDLTARLVMPDWGTIITLIPVALAGLVFLGFLWLFLRARRAGPAQRGPGRVAPRTPAGIHMPGPSLAPFLVAAGSALAVIGFVLGGVVLVLGLAALVLALLYWLREALTDYDRIESTATTLPAVVEAGPPEGVHIPGPSFRPLLVSAAAAVLFLGLVLGPAVLVAGVVLLIGALFGWLRDARAEYALTVEADRTGHLRNPPEPRFPVGSVVVGAAILALALVVNAGIVPPGDDATAGGSPPPSGSPGASAAPSGEPGASGEPVPEADVTITAEGIKFLETAVTVPANREFTIAFVNKDAGIGHNVEIDDASGGNHFVGDIFPGVETRIYTVPALAPGTYPFICTVHPNMTGTITAQ
jgi:plastocyanin